MKILFVENFKGFKKEYLEFKDFNFFVGENSTGKTSLLSLINLVSRPNFWLSPDFNDDEIELGHFNEIVNANTVGVKYFQIGVYFGIKKLKNTDNIIHEMILLKFKEKDAVPSISEFKYVSKDNTILVNIGDKEIRYRSKKTPNYNKSELDTFSSWIEDEDFENTFNKLDKTRLKKNLPLGILKNMIEIELSDKNNITNFIDLAFKINTLYPNFTWIAPIRAKAKRVYESFKFNFSPEGEHIPILLKRILTDNKDNRNHEIKNILEKFGKESSLFDEIKIKELGSDKGAPFEINIFYQGISIKLPNVGYGVSQILPILVEILSSKKDLIAIQQPEVHLHPKAQAAFGEFIYSSYVSNNNQFIIETHSDYTIDRFRYTLGKDITNNKKPKAQVIFFERKERNTIFHTIPIEHNGDYSDNQPVAFREFFLDEQIKMLEL